MDDQHIEDTLNDDPTDNRLVAPVFDLADFAATTEGDEQDAITDDEVREAYDLNPPPPKQPEPHPYAPLIEGLAPDKRPDESIACLRCPAAVWRHRLKNNTTTPFLVCSCRLLHDTVFNADDPAVSPVTACGFQITAEDNHNNPKPKLKHGQDMAAPDTNHTP